MTLPDHEPGCPGVGSDAEGWREGCDVCLRRLSGGGDYVPWMTPPPIVAFECEFLIEVSE